MYPEKPAATLNDDAREIDRNKAADRRCKQEVDAVRQLALHTPRHALLSLLQGYWLRVVRECPENEWEVVSRPLSMSAGLSLLRIMMLCGLHIICKSLSGFAKRARGQLKIVS
jgi:hypothetical protein